MSDVVQTLCQILSAKEKLTLLPNTQSITLIIQFVGQMKEIEVTLGHLLVPEQSKFLSQAAASVMAHKKAYGDLLNINAQLQRLIPKTVEWDKVEVDAATIIKQAIVAAEKLKGIHKLDKDLFKIVIKTQELIKNHQNKAIDFVQQNSKKQKELNKVEEEELEYRYDSDTGEAVLVVESQKQQTKTEAPAKVA